MNLARFSVNRPVAAGIISLALLVVGIYYQRKLPVALYPEVSLPFVQVTVPLPGASAEQIEKKVVKPLEKELGGVKGVKRVIARIRAGVATVVVGFRMDVNEREAVDGVRDMVAKVRPTFPRDAREPIVTRVDVGATPVLIYGIETTKTPDEAKKLLDDGLVRELTRTPGVKDAEVLGLGEEQVEVALDPAKLAALRIAPLDVYQQLSTYVATVPWGDVRGEGTVLSVARASLPQDAKYWEDHQLTLADGRSVRLGEIGVVRPSREEEAEVVRINGKAGLGLVITKRSEANTVETVARVQKIVDELDASAGVKLFPILEQSKYIEANAHEVWIALFAGGLFAVLVVLFFLTDVKSALITATALPVSVAATFIVMSFLGFSLNMMSLLALALAIGLLIDDAVVVREAIFSEIEAGKTPKEAAIAGTDRVQSAVLATTLAVVAVFVPVSAMEGMVGQFFKEFGLTIVAAVIFSLWVAFTLDPMLSARFGGKHEPLRGRVWDAWRRFLASTDRGARNLATWAFRRPSLVILVSIALLVTSVALMMRRGADFLAFEDRGQLIVNVAAPAGASREKTSQLADEAAGRLRDLPGLKDIYAVVGGNHEPTKAELRLVFVDKTERKEGLMAIAKVAREKLAGFEGDALVMEPPPVEGVGAEAPIAVYVYGEDLPTLFTESDRVAGEMRKIKGIADVRVETARYSPGVDIAIDAAELGYRGTNAAAVEATGRLALTGLEAGSVGAENIPLVVRFPKAQRSSQVLLDSTYVPTPKGPELLSSLVTTRISPRPTSIDRERRSRKVVLFGSLDRSRSLENIMQDIAGVLTTIPKPMTAEIAGDKEMFDEMQRNFAIAIIGSAFFIFVILAIQFENVLRPFIILLTLPLAVIGAFLALYVAGEKLALGAMIGIVLLIGLAAKNGILLVDAIGVRERAGGSLRDAVLASVHDRFRPILMTSVAMIFGMLPTALMRGAGSEFRSPMAIAVIGGVVSSTLLSVAIVPAIFGLIAAVRARKAARVAKKSGLARNATIGTATALLLALMLLPLSFSPAARADEADDAAVRRADLATIARVLNAPARGDSEQAYLALSAREMAEGVTAYSHSAFLGEVKVEASREWARPGDTQSIDLPLPPQLGGPVHQDLILQPKVQNVYTASWSFPVFNLQAIRALHVASRSRDQNDIVTRLEREEIARARARQILALELALAAQRLERERVDIATTRVTNVRSRLSAGLGRRMQLEESEAALASARAALEQAGTEVERARVAFAAVSDEVLPAEGFGLPDFPLALDRPFSSSAIKALEAAAELQAANVEVVDAAFAPTVDVAAARQIKDYEGGPDPQNIVAVRASWVILDAGSRRRNITEARRAVFDAKARAAATHLDLTTAYQTLKSRVAGARHGLDARKAALRASEQAVADAKAAFDSGSGSLLDLRTADEARLGAAFGVEQGRVELAGLALESLALTDSLVAFMEHEGHI